MITVVTWLWGNKYDWSYVTKLRDGVLRHLKCPHRFVCVSDKDVDWRNTMRDGVEVLKMPNDLLPFTQIKGCFARLAMFNPHFQYLAGRDELQRGLGPTDIFLQLDLDVVITSDLSPVLEGLGSKDFAILAGVNAVNPCPFNGSVQVIRARTNSPVWSEFTLDAAKAVPFHSFPDDQGWLWEKIGDRAARIGPAQGVYAFNKPGWPQGQNIPNNAAVVCFPGSADPSKWTKLDWVRNNWVEDKPAADPVAA